MSKKVGLDKKDILAFLDSKFSKLDSKKGKEDKNTKKRDDKL